jgi:hypothetical protein
VQGFGEAYPIAANVYGDGRDNPAGRAKNRRVEVIILNEEQQQQMAPQPEPARGPVYEPYPQDPYYPPSNGYPQPPVYPPSYPPGPPPYGY